MCKSQAEGGQRCASHTRTKYTATSTDDPNWDTVAAEYASTSEGEAHLKGEAIQAMEQGDYETAARLNTVTARGITMREANRAAAEAIAATAQNDLRRREPADIDSELADLYGKAYELDARIAQQHDHIAAAVARLNGKPGFRARATPA